MNELLDQPEISDVPDVGSEPETKTRILTLRSPDELLAMRFDDSDVILGDRLLAKGQPLVIAAQGGTGKSRLALQIIAAIVTGRKCLSFTTGCNDMRWLILQTENSNRRLQQDLARIKAWLATIGSGSRSKSYFTRLKMMTMVLSRSIHRRINWQFNAPLNPPHRTAF
jgi:hypothetical protein